MPYSFLEARQRSIQGRTINHPGGVVRGAMARFFFLPRFLLGTIIFGPNLGPIFFLHFLPLCPMGGNQWLDFLFFQKFWPDFYFGANVQTIFFSFSDHPHPWMIKNRIGGVSKSTLIPPPTHPLPQPWYLSHLHGCLFWKWIKCSN